MPVTSIAGLVRRGDLGALVPKGGGLTKVKDLEGKKVAYTAGTRWGPRIDPFLEADRDQAAMQGGIALIPVFLSRAFQAGDT